MKYRKDLSDDEIKYIRLCFPGGPPRGRFDYNDKAKEFEISRNMVINIVRKKVRPDVEIAEEDKTYSSMRALEDRLNDEYDKKQKEKIL